MQTVIVDYGSGNLHSAAKAFERMAAPGQSILVSSTVEDIAAADRIVLPGVGAFADCRAGLAAVDGLIEVLEETVHQKGRPFLGICVGMQLMAETGLEHGTHSGLGWIPGKVAAITPADTALKVPHMGWNAFSKVSDHPVLSGLTPGHFVYFVHSYHMLPDRVDDVLAEVDYGGNLTAFVGRDTMVGAQFHPEKSQSAGLRLIQNFLNWAP